jgi:hypothetical protein
MPVPVSGVSWWGSLLWLIGLTVAAFAVSWVTGTRLRIRRPAYIGILVIVTGALSAGYVAWLGVGVGDLLSARWAWGLLAGVVMGIMLAFGMSHQPVTRRLHGGQLARALAWEGVIYGTAEGVLLSALPAFMTWQMIHSLGWGGVTGALARWLLPVAAAAVVIVVHHLGYWNCRNMILVPITLGCSLLTVGYLLTASVLAPVVGHIIMHCEADLRGVEMPPVPRPSPAEVQEPIQQGSLPQAA